MQKKQLFFLALTLVAGSAFAQINKGSWLIGGNGSFSYSRTSYSQFSSSTEALDLLINPQAGYFFLQKFAAGINGNIQYSKVHNSSGTTSGIGPFARYYFLNPANRWNLLTEASYTFLKQVNSPIHTLGLRAGPVWFITPNTGLEITLNYYAKTQYTYPNSSEKTSYTGLQLGIGFQVHLNKKSKDPS